MDHQGSKAVSRLFKPQSKLRRVLRTYRENKSGSVIVLFAAGLTTMLVATGAAVEYANGLRVQSKLQAAADAGVIAGVTDTSNTSNCSSQGQDSSNDTCLQTNSNKTKQLVERTVASTFKAQTQLAPTVRTTIDADGTVTTVATANVPTYFGAILKKATVPVTVTSQAKRGSGKLEVALVLDTTGSMSGTKMDTLKIAAANLVTTLFNIPDATNRVKVSVVPFAQYVNIGTTYRGASWLSDSEDLTSSGVDTGIDYPNATYSNPYTVNQTCYNDGAPYDCSYTAYATVNLGVGVPYSRPWTYTARWYGCVGSRNYPLDVHDAVDSVNKVPAFRDTWCSAELTRLTNSPTALATAINGLSASGETYIPDGLLWGWRALSPRMPFKDGAASGPNVQKHMIVMTDGQNTLAPYYPYHWGGDTSVTNSLTSETCTNIKADNITVYTVAFSVTDTTIKNILRNCASQSQNYFDATTAGDLTAAFARIGALIMAVRLSK